MRQVFQILIFSQDIWANVHYVPKLNLISEGTRIKAVYLPIKANLRHAFVDERQLKMIMPK